MTSRPLWPNSTTSHSSQRGRRTYRTRPAVFSLDFTTGFNMGHDAVVGSLMLHVRAGDSAIGLNQHPDRALRTAGYRLLSRRLPRTGRRRPGALPPGRSSATASSMMTDVSTAGSVRGGGARLGGDRIARQKDWIRE